MEDNKLYEVIFDIGHSIDGKIYKDKEQAINMAEDILLTWGMDGRGLWKWEERNGKIFPNPTQEQIDQYDAMIMDCSCWVEERTEKESVEIWPSAEDLYELDWLTWNEYLAKYDGIKELINNN